MILLRSVSEHLKTRLRRARANGHGVFWINQLAYLKQRYKNGRDYLQRKAVIAALDGDRPQGDAELVEFVMTVGQGFLRPMQNTNEVTGLAKLVRERQPRSVLEIGTARGGTLFLLAQAAAADAHIVSLDLPDGRNGGGYPAWKAPIYRKFARAHQTMSLVRANSHSAQTRDQVASLAGPRGFDFILIDADHSYEGARIDFELYAPLLAPGGMIAMHDVLHNRFDPEINVAPLWAEIRSKYANTREIIDDVDQGVFGIGLVFPELGELSRA